MDKGKKYNQLNRLRGSNYRQNLMQVTLHFLMIQGRQLLQTEYPANSNIKTLKKTD